MDAKEYEEKLESLLFMFNRQAEIITAQRAFQESTRREIEALKKQLDRMELLITNL